jgi:hypothetical protein
VLHSGVIVLPCEYITYGGAERHTELFTAVVGDSVTCALISRL